MSQPAQISFERYLDAVFASPNWLDACVNMLCVFLEDVHSARDDPRRSLSDVAPSIVDQVAAVADRVERRQQHVRGAIEERGPEFQTDELGAVLWWSGMGAHKAAAAAASARGMMARGDWEDAFYEINALLYDTVSALSLLAVAEGMVTGQTARTGPDA